MGENKSLRITDPELEAWVDEHIEKGCLNSVMNDLLIRYKNEQEQEYREMEQENETQRRLTIFQGIVFSSIGVWFIVFAASQFIDFFVIFSEILMIISGVLLCLYVLLNIRKKQGRMIA